MIIGVGTDIVDVERIEKVYKKQGAAFSERLLSDAELLEFKNQLYPERFLAKRWALKEAVSKALGTGIAHGVRFKDMTVGHKESGQPILLLAGSTLEKSNELGITHWSISISDEKHHTVAFVVAERNND
ncbi:holo-[acyl-carrier-protein] synthase [Thiomicrorhabdus immobilis]|uniref:Holo-[acyl-carrier-protein] synthase n=1 Tax=Thiomicrorhabdus immobilis TaxID=2791037 RepID=A0ABN6CVT4_9GAMM|nr:holo-ACP synthase [Thiomicrorhabdus immobilis]BCN93161.1 holo-[acyl-carrier-protein] synthase [Thiomicrorhabdus immobilis]